MDKKLKTAYGLGRAGSILALITFIVGALVVLGVIILYVTGVANYDNIREAISGSRIMTALNIPMSVVEGALFSGILGGGMWITRLLYVFLFALPSMILSFIGVKSLHQNKTKGAVLFLIAAGLMVPYLFVRSILGFVAFGLLLAAGIVAIVPENKYSNYNDRGNY